MESFVSTLNREFAIHARSAEPEKKNSLIPVVHRVRL
jgi:hypothetical protein